MANVTEVKVGLLGLARLKVTKVDGELKETTDEYKLVLDFNGLFKIRQLIGKDLVLPANWSNLDSTEISTIAWCAFNRFHPEVTLENVREWISPAEFGALYSMLLEMCFPGITERMSKAMESGKDLGEQQPNPPVPS